MPLRRPLYQLLLLFLLPAVGARPAVAQSVDKEPALGLANAPSAAAAAAVGRFPIAGRSAWRGAWAAVATTAVAYGFLHDEIEIRCASPLAQGTCPAPSVVSRTSVQPHRTAGLLVGGVALIAGWLHTRRDPGSAASATFEPRVHGPGRLSLVRLPLLGGGR